ncbi:glycosyltransferase [Megalodesulfovibrio gigas]|uniref:Putative group 1 glycosyl transferase n=1 Tax=Megalodesulfovibrio gigas (strain ATCC 19364 / DSM 1382 / NCIMB 9332 / VKM B-1759) TaxID=1121448 RepID=T2GE41_MEGG1|nr:glycosyltransferase [Megalodesulfovibrio gigas]AGW14449.1 putative group 1 glycosyl transferase [Megalodesulfovibrio gigas DSM 1382 = ATCC 19364]
MRILHVVNDFLPFTRAGTEHYLAELLAGQQGLGLASAVLHLAPPDAAPAYGIVAAPYASAPTCMLGVPREDRDAPENPRVAAAVAAWLQANPADVVHIHSLIGFSVSLLDALPPQTPVVMTLHDFWLFCANAILVRGEGRLCAGPRDAEDCAACHARARREATADPERIRHRNACHRRAGARLDLAICPSHFSRRLYARHGFDGPHLVRAPLGMRAVEPVRPVPAPPPAGAGVRFVFLGGLCWFKGADLAVRAFLALASRGIGPARLDIHGLDSNPEYARAVRTLAAGHPDIAFHGPYAKADLGRILGGADALLLPSHVETYSFVAREALSAGVPVIAADCGALPEVVRHEKNGLLFRSGDAAHLAASMARVLGDAALLPRLRAGIRPVVTVEEDAARLVRLYRDCLQRRRADTLRTEM